LTYCPILRQDANGKYYLEFDGVDDHLIVELATGITRNIGYITMAGGVKITNAADNGAIFYASSSGGETSTRAALRFDSADSSFGVGGRRLDSDSLQEVTTSPPVGVFSAVGYLDYANASAGAWVNKTRYIEPTVFQTAGLTSDTEGTHVSIGAVGYTASANFNGDIYSVVVVARELTADERYELERYLYYTTGQTIYNAGDEVRGVARWQAGSDTNFLSIKTALQESA